MEKVLFFLGFVCFFQSSAQIIDIPDAVFKYRLTHGYPNFNFGYDTNHDGEIDQAEANAITVLNLPHTTTIHDITGIRFFNNLVTLNLTGSRIYNLDLHGMTSLKMLTCPANLGALNSIDVSGCTSLETIMASGNPLTSINLSGRRR